MARGSAKVAEIVEKKTIQIWGRFGSLLGLFFATLGVVFQCLFQGSFLESLESDPVPKMPKKGAPGGGRTSILRATSDVSATSHFSIKTAPGVVREALRGHFESILGSILEVLGAHCEYVFG